MKRVFHIAIVFFFLISSLLGLSIKEVKADISFDIGVNEEFLQPNIAAGGVSTLRIYFYNTNAFQMLLSSNPAALSYTLPVNLNFSDPINITNTCGGLITTSGTTFSLLGGTIPAMTNGNQGTCSISIQVTTTKANTYYSQINANTIVAADPNGNPATNSKGSAEVSLTVSSVQPPSLSKTFSPNTIWTGQTSTMSLRITNTDHNYSLTKVSVTDSLPAGITLSSTSFTSSNCGSPTMTRIDGTTLSAGAADLKVNNATIAPNTTCSVNFTVSATTPGAYINSIPAQAVQTQQGVTNSSAASAPLNVQNITVTKSFSPGTVMVGGQSTMTVTLQNPSGGDYMDVSFIDNLPSGMTVVPGTLATTCNKGTVNGVVITNASSSTVELNGGVVAAGKNCTVTATVTIAVAGSYTNSLPAGSLKIGSTGITNVVAATANLSSYGSGLGMTGSSKSFSPRTIAVGGTSRLTINIKAPADVTALHHVSVQDTLPDGLMVASSPAVTTLNCGTPTFTPQSGDTSLSFSNGTIQGNATCSFSVMVTATKTGTFTNVISSTNISDDEGRNISGTLQDTLTVSGLSVGKAFYPTAVNQGNLSTLTIQLTNDNTDQLNSVSLTDSLPSGLTVADDGITTNIVNTCGGTVTAPLNATSIQLSGGTVPAKVGTVSGTCTINVDVKANKTGTLTNTISAGAVSGTLNTSGITISNPGSASASLQVQNLTITINKSFSPVSVTGGSTSTLSVYLSNPNNYPLSGIAFIDNLPQSGTGSSGMHVATAPNVSTGGCGGSVSIAGDRNSFTYSGGSLGVNSSCTLTIDVVMDYDGNLTNTIKSGDVTSTNGASNPLAGTATLYNSPGAYIVKTFYNIDANAHTADMKVTITNDYSYQITGIKFIDTLPAGMTLVSADTDQCNGTVTSTSTSLSIAGGSLMAGNSCDVLASVKTGSAGSFENCIADGAMQIDQKDASGNAITNHGNACDTLVTTDEVVPPAATKSFNPASIPLGSSSEMDILIHNPNTIALSDVSFSDTLPVGMTLTSVPNPTQCNGGTVTWDSTNGILSLAGGALAAGAKCTVVVSVTGSSSLVYENSVLATASDGTGTLTSNTSTASLTVVAPPQISKSFNSNSILANDLSTLTFDIVNPADNSASLTGVGFVDNLPSGVKVAATPAAAVSSDCGGATFNPAAGAAALTMSGASIAVGATCEVSVNVTAINGGTYTNTTQAVTSTNGGTGNTATAVLDVSGPGLTLEKSTTTANYKAKDDTIHYSYLLTNSGNTDLYADFQVFDDHINSGAAIDCNNGNSALVLHPGETTTCSADYPVTDADLSAKSVTNTAYATAKDSGENAVTSNKDSVTVKEAKLTIVKTTSSVSYFKTGTKLNYTYMLTNTGSVLLKAPFTVSDDHINSGTPFTCGTASELAPGANTSCTSSYTTLSTDMAAETMGVTNIAYADALDKGGLDVRSNTASVTVPKLDTPAITKEFDPAVIAVSRTSTMKITITNPTWSDTNMVPLTGVNFTDTFPSGLLMVNTPDVNQCGGTVSWNSTTGTISFSGGTVIGPSCTITALVSANSAGVITNTAGNVNASNSASSTETAAQRSASLTIVQGAVITKSFSPDTVLQGQQSTLTLVLDNPASNTQTLEGVAFTDSFPAGMMVYTTPNATITNCGDTAVFTPTAGASSLSFSGGEIPVGESCILTVDVSAPSAGQYLNTTGAITSTNGGTGATSNTASLTVKKTADLQITKTDGVSDVTRGEAVNYTIVVTNAGPSDATGAAIVDNIPSNLTGAAWTCSPTGGATCTASGSGNINDTINLPVGGIATYTVSASVSTSAVSSVANIIVVTPPSDISDSNLLNNIASDVDSYESLTIVKSAVPTTYSEIGSEINYTYTITNTGTSTLKKPFNVYDDKLVPTCSSIPDTLISGAQFACTGKHELTNDDLDAGSITNNAYATGTDNDGDLVTSNTDIVTVNSDQNPVIGLAKEATKVKLVSTGTYDVTYTLRMQNYGNVTLHDLELTDDLVSTFPSTDISSFSVISIDSSSLIFNPAFNGDSDQELLLTGNTLLAGESKSLVIVVRVIPLSHGPFYNTAAITAKDPSNGTVSDDSQNGSNPDSDSDGNPNNNASPTVVDFGSQIFDPITGKKVLNDAEMPTMHWSMIWMNNQNIVPVDTIIYDPIPEHTEYIQDGSDSKIAPPADAPDGSTFKGVVCTVLGKSITKYCYYEGPTSEYPRGRVVWVGTLSPDYGVTDLLLAANSVQIAFSTKSDERAQRIVNIAYADEDLNGDGDMSDSGETDTASVTEAWNYKPEKLPASGFAPGVVTLLPSQPKALNYTSTAEMSLEIPALKVDIPIIGVPQASGTWDISWLGTNAGWLNGTAYPTHTGNSVLTAHVVDSNGLTGPFANLDKLKYGDQIIVQAWNQQYIYQVRETKIINSDDIKNVLKHEEAAWITLLTCRDYDAKTGTYLHHYLVRAVLIKVQ